MKQFLALLLLFIGLAFQVNAQDLRSTLIRGKEQLRTRNYEGARRSFNEVLAVSDRNPFAPYAMLYLGLTELRSGDAGKARESFLKLDAQFPSWDKKDDLNYWIARSEFELEKFPAAFRQIEKIRSLSVLRDAQAMESHFLEEVEDLAQLESLYQTFPENPRIGLQFAKVLLKTGDATAQTRAKIIREKFNISPEALFESPAPTLVKDEYHAAVLLPFMVSELSAGGNYRNSIYLDLYAGMQMAREELLQEGIRLNLYPYDTRREIPNTQSILNFDELKGLDFIIGPGFESVLPPIAQFAETQKMALVNPLSMSTEGYKNNPFIISGRPGNETIAKKTAEFAQDQFQNKSAIIVYGNSPRDQQIAGLYRKEIEAKGFRVIAYEMVQQQENTAFFNRLRSLQVGTSSNPGVGHIFVASDAPSVVASIMSVMTVRGDNVPMIGMDSWLGLTGISHEQLERLGVYLVGFGTVDYTKENLQKFRDRYIQKHGIFPPNYAYLGYDLVMVIGKSLEEFGTQFQAALKEGGKVDGVVTGGYWFQNQIDNQYLPFLQIKDGALRIISE